MAVAAHSFLNWGSRICGYYLPPFTDALMLLVFKSDLTIAGGAVPVLQWYPGSAWPGVCALFCCVPFPAACIVKS